MARIDALSIKLQGQEGNDKLAESIQRRLNTISYPRNLKKMPDVYMYRYLKIKGVLIEVGFISNNYERTKLLDLSYQDKLALNITYGIIDYFN